MSHNKKSHEMIRGAKGRFLKNTKANRKNKNNTIERVPNPGRGDTKH